MRFIVDLKAYLDLALPHQYLFVGEILGPEIPKIHCIYSTTDYCQLFFLVFSQPLWQTMHILYENLETRISKWFCLPMA